MAGYNGRLNNLALEEKLLKPPKKNKLWKQYLNQRELFFMIIPCMILAFIFSYLPLTGWIMAFENFRPHLGYFGSQWVGFDQFKFLFTNHDFWLAFRNTVAMSLLSLFFGTVCAIGFALLLNEVRNRFFKRFIQSISYLPHFLSWIIVCALISGILSTYDGTLNNLLMGLGIIHKPILWLGEPKYFWWLNTFANLWKEVGWDSIIYLAAMSSIDPELYESCEMDGGNRFTKMWHITLPGIRTTILVLLIMKVGWVLNVGFEFPYIVGNKGVVLDVSRTIDIFVLKYGLELGNYSLTTAAGMFKSVIAIALVLYTNRLARKTDEGAFL
ncbi:MAG: ABC transporter permease subunit [Firmicutes bacterium]|nr:ABC transporter permease subunit [Bacillota bacterium]